MLGIIPAAGAGQRIQPLGCSKELLPVGSREVKGVERPKAVAEYLVERMISAGAEQICMVISGEKGDIVRYFAEREYAAEIFYTVQPAPAGLCDAVFRAQSFVAPHEHVLVGLPDTIWFPKPALSTLPDVDLSFLLFPVEHPEFFDAVVLDGASVKEIQVKKVDAASNWIWGAFKMSSAGFRDLHLLWQQRQRRDEYFGTLVNSYLAAGGKAVGVKAGHAYVDVGTIDGYRQAITLLAGISDGDDERRFNFPAASISEPAAASAPTLERGLT
jgi:glucose-1-phosphate thymidylyltransferase